MGFSVVGGVTGALAEVESANLALRVTPRPIDIGSTGSYLLAVSNGTTQMTAGLAAGSPIFSWRWGNGSNVAKLNALRLWVGTNTAFAAGLLRFEAFFARSFSASDTGGTSLTLTTNNAKKRTSHATTLLTDARISATGTLSAGTRTLDAQPFGEALFATIATNPNPPMFQADLYRRDVPDAWPLVFAQNEGFVIQANVPATGTWFFGVQADWDELATY